MPADPYGDAQAEVDAFIDTPTASGVREYLVVLAIEADEAEGDPARWDWGAMLDTPYAVGVSARMEVTGKPVGLSLFRLGCELQDRLASELESRGK